MDQQVTRPDLSGEVRFRVPLVFVIPLGAILIIGLLAFGFAQVLLSLESKEAATAIAIVMAANVLAACAFVALRPRLQRGSIVELALVALYPVVIGIAIAQVGIVGGETHATETQVAPSGGEGTQPEGTGGLTSEVTAAGLVWDTEAITLAAGEPIKLEVVNDDTTIHNLSIYETPEDAQSQSNPLFDGPDVPAGATESYEIDPLKAGEYAFICDYHVNMQGTVTVE